MRRRIPNHFEQAPPAVARDPRGEWLLDLRLPLETITPVIGGGVIAGEPTEEEPLRVAGIRGSLRRFWRATTRVPDDELFRREAHIFGGVGLGGDFRGPDARRSRVAVSALVDDPGRLQPAGVHRVGREGRVRALPEWDLGVTMGYALFPFQLSEAERQGPIPPGGLPTKRVRSALRFTLRVRLHAARSDDKPAYDDEVVTGEVLTALWAFVHFGGIGARQGRGFGAVAPQSGVGASGLDHLPQTWRHRFAPPERVDRAFLEPLHSERGQRRTRPSLLDALILVGVAQTTAAKAHEDLVGALKQFRQGSSVGREQRPGRREGTSHWPEARVLRALRDAAGRGAPWEHPPEPVLVQAARHSKDELAIPRAAFGLPIELGFKDPRDKRANATIAYLDPEGGRCERYGSPLRLRPIRCRDGYAPVAVIDRNRPEKVQVKFKDDGGRGPTQVETLQVRAGASLGMRPPIRDWLAQANGDALDAFATYLSMERRFEPPAGHG